MNPLLSTVLLAGLSTTAVVLPTTPSRAQEVAPAPADEVALSSLDVSRAIQFWTAPRKNQSLAKKPLTVAGQEFKSGVSTHARSLIHVGTSGNAARLSGSVGLDDNTNDKRKTEAGSVAFHVKADGKTLWQSGVMRRGDKAKPFSVDLKGARIVTLEVTDGDDGLSNDHGDWLDVRFGGVTGPIQVIERLPADEGKIVPGATWRDTKGELIQAHGGGVLEKDGTYYWYGEDRSNGYVGIGVSGYKSRDLVNWEPMGVVLPKSAYDEKWGDQNINERPKVVYNESTKKFVMWFHYDRSGYGDSRAGIATADKPEGPFQYLGQMRPLEESTYRDQTLFVDDDGTAYAVYSGEGNATTYIVRLNDEWTAPQMPMVEGETWARAMPKQWREAAAVWKYNGKYYMMTSGTSGWDPNQAKYSVADNMLGPWKIMGDPFVGMGGGITFSSQSTHVLPLGGNKFVYMGDRWSKDNLKDSRYVWLPFEMKPDGSFEVNWRESWKPSDVGFTPVAANSDGPLRYRLAEGSDNWPAEKKTQIVAAMDEAVAFYNGVGRFDKQIVASYNENVPTADGNYNGNIRFGKQISSRTALHEVGHILGIGTVGNWSKLIVDGKWTGQNAIAQLQEFDGAGAVLYADRQHFWPYGLNFAGEDVPDARRRHVMMVAAFRADLGIDAAPPAKVAAPPANLATPPAKVAAPPADLEAPPAKAAAPPANLGAPPAKVAAPPANVVAAPATALAPLASAMAAPVTAMKPPANPISPVTTAPPTLAGRDFLTLPGADWKLSFSDEFNGTTLDGAKWNIGLPWGGTDGTGRHHNSGYASYIMDDDVKVRDGSLHLTTQRRDVTGKNGQVFNYTQGMITTAKTFRSGYGYFESRVKMPTQAGPGLWPAFWTLADGWPPEFDIVEYWGSQGRIHQGTVTKKADGSQRWESYNSYDTSISGWHTYGLEWGPGYQHYNIDGKITKSIYGAHLAGLDKQYLLLNSGVETKEPPTAATQFPNDFEVDYTRVYARPEVTALSNGDFENEVAGAWTRNGRAVVMDYDAFGGTRALRADGGDKTGGMSQIIYGLMPNTRYRLTARAKTIGDAKAQLIARDYNGAATQIQSSTSRAYAPVTLEFTTGAEATSATIACEANGAGTAFFDDVTLVKVG